MEIDTSIFNGDSPLTSGGGFGGALGGLSDFLKTNQGAIQGIAQGAGLLQSGKTSQNVANAYGLSPEAKAALAKLLGIDIGAIQDQFSKGSAVSDSATSTQSITQDILRSNIPGLTVGQSAAGVYGNQTSKLLQDNVVAAAAAAGSKNQLDYISQYSVAQLNALKPILEALNIDQKLVDSRAKAAAAQGAGQKDSTGGILGIASGVGSLLGIGGGGGILGGVTKLLGF
jgi:hypothetical protein